MAKADRIEVTRRKFCSRLFLTLTTVVLAAKELLGKSLAQRRSAVAYPPVRIAGAGRLMPGSFLNFTYPSPNDPAVLVRSAEGEFFAHSRKCAHLGCSVEFDARRKCLDCPCHNGMYDPRTGAVLYGPPTRSLEPIFLETRAGGEIWAIGKGTG